MLFRSKKYFKPQYGALIAKNQISYAGKSLEFRERNPKKFTYRYKASIKDIFLADDIITTGTSMNEARRVVESSGAKVWFGIALCDARS